MIVHGVGWPIAVDMRSSAGSAAPAVERNGEQAAMGDGFQFMDIILLAMIAAFLIFRLRGVLGRRDGHEGNYRDPFRPDKTPDHADDGAPANDDTVVHLTDRGQKDGQGDDEDSPYDRADGGADDALSMGLRDIRKADPEFDAGQFVEGANGAFEMVLNAYVAGDTATLKNLLSSDVYSNFAKAISDREQAGETLEDTLVDIRSSDVVEAYLEGHQAFVTVKFVTEQVNVTRDENGDVVDGNATEIVTITDFWTFARDTRSRDPNWMLAATRSMD